MVDIDIGACKRVNLAIGAGTTPTPIDTALCRNATLIADEIRKAMMARMPFPERFPVPFSEPLRREPEPELSFPSAGGLLVGELIAEELKREEPSTPTLRAIKDSGIHIQVVKQLISDLCQAQEFLQKELKTFENQ